MLHDFLLLIFGFEVGLLAAEPSRVKVLCVAAAFMVILIAKAANRF